MRLRVSMGCVSVVAKVCVLGFPALLINNKINACGTVESSNLIYIREVCSVGLCIASSPDSLICRERPGNHCMCMHQSCTMKT